MHKSYPVYNEGRFSSRFKGFDNNFSTYIFAAQTKDCLGYCDTNDVSCIQSCNRSYVESLKQCPCHEQCIDGCPCPSYKCPTVLGLNTWNQIYTTDPQLINTDGDQLSVAFEYDKDTEVDGSCSVLFNNQFFVFGGKKLTYQISTVENCRLRKYGELPFSFFRGACTVGAGQLILCFHDSSMSPKNKQCRRASEPNGDFTIMSDSNHGHARALIAASDGEWNNELSLLVLVLLQNRH